ncbi:MAG: 4Fe-4S dicluster domain-containing protein [Candidatus Aminicenantes bacterium]|nr:4Fe-4S dicluster domain-containing protein [Candidatus Aminicenantes bacterium]
MKKERSKKYRAIQALRVISQILFFSLFFYLLLGTHFPGKDYIGNVEIFFHFDPLLALTTIIAAKAVFVSFVFAAITIVLTFILGRFVCGWVCPLGSIHQFFSFVFKKSKLLKPKKIKNNLPALKYYILVIILIGTVFSLNLVGIMDPLSLLYRSFAVGVMPVLNHTFSNVIGLLYQAEFYSVADPVAQFFTTLDINSLFTQVFFIGLLFLGIAALNIHRERFWCRYLCPLGALLALFSRWNILKLNIDPQKCIECNLCTIHCETQANPFPNHEWKSSECIYCFTCSSICPTNAIRFPLKTMLESIETVNLSRRKLLFTSLAGLVAVPFFRLSPESKRASEKLIRPPGALPEKQFLEKCVKCGECMKVCPTNAIQPALKQAGPEGLWTPMLVPEIGYCEYYCSLCTQVCPTGAIKELTVPEKTQVKIGTSWINKNRCIPWKFGDPCIVCEEHCPVSPKAIKLLNTEVKTPEGEIKTPLAPVIDTELCIGCGICENKCPVVDQPAVYVTSVGESRSEENQLKLDLISGSGGIY